MEKISVMKSGLLIAAIVAFVSANAGLALIAGLNGIGNTIEGVVLFELDVGTQLYLPTDAEAERFLNNL